MEIGAADFAPGLAFDQANSQGSCTLSPQARAPSTAKAFDSTSQKAMSSLRLLSVLALSLLCACSSMERAATWSSEAELLEVAEGIHRRVLTLDTHCDFRLTNFTEERNYTMELDSQVTLPKMEAGGLDVAWLIVYTGQGDLDEAGYARAHENAIAKFDAIHRLCSEYAPDRIGLARTSEEARSLAAEGKKVAMIGVENAYPVGLDLANIEDFYERGGRYMSLSHQGHSQFCDSNTGERDDVWLHGGLSDLGRRAIVEMNRLGMLIDLSHPSRAANLETLELSRAPVIASHSSARALNDVSRNLTDEELLRLRDNGGVVQTVAFQSYVNADKHAAWREVYNEARERIAASMGIEILSWSARGELPEAERVSYDDSMARLRRKLEPELDAIAAQAPPVNVADFVDHIDYMVELIGLEHVGISSDFDGGGGVQGWSDASETLAVTVELVRRGYSEGEIAQLWSGNLLRVLDEAQAVAREIQAEG